MCCVSPSSSSYINAYMRCSYTTLCLKGTDIGLVVLCTSTQTRDFLACRQKCAKQHHSSRPKSAVTTNFECIKYLTPRLSSSSGNKKSVKIDNKLIMKVINVEIFCGSCHQHNSPSAEGSWILTYSKNNGSRPQLWCKGPYGLVC